MARTATTKGSSPASKNPVSETVLLRIPKELLELLDAQRGKRTRSAIAVVALARGLGLTDPEGFAPQRGRPKGLKKTFVETVVPAPAISPEIEQPPLSFTPSQPSKAVAFLKIVNWKGVLSKLPDRSDHEAPATLYLAADGSYIRWRYGTTGVEKKLYDYVRKAEAIWSRTTGWQLPDKTVWEGAREIAVGGGWRVADAEELTAPPVQLEAIRCADDAWALSINCADWKQAIETGWGGHLLEGFWCLAKATDHAWVHSPFDDERLLHPPMTRSDLTALIAALPSSGCEFICNWRSDEPGVQEWSRVPVRIVDGDLVHAIADLGNPLHLAVLTQEIKAAKADATVKPGLTLPREEWRAVADRFEAMGGRIEIATTRGRLKAEFDSAIVPGWERPAPCGHKLFAHQRTGIEFLVGHGMRAILGDEMGLGKTGQAIGAAIAAQARRVLVIAPANARFVWERELLDWAGAATIIVHLKDSLSEVALPNVGWAIITYDLLVARAEKWTADTPEEEAAIFAVLDQAGIDRQAFDGAVKGSTVSEKDEAWVPHVFNFNPRKVAGIGEALCRVDLADHERADRLRRMGRRLSAEIFDRLQEWDPDLIYIDEAHRIKNADAARTRVVRALLGAPNRGAVLLTGTPLRNHAGEGGALIEAIFPGAAGQLGRHKGNHRGRDEVRRRQIEAVSALLKTAMLRRLKKDALDLPSKVHQFIEIEPSGEYLEDYVDTLCVVEEKMRETIGRGGTLAHAKKSVLGLLSKARRLLGLAKIDDGSVADQIDAIVEAKTCCIVFTAHQDVTDGLAKQLRRMRRKVVVVDGRTPQEARAEAEKSFQAGDADVFIGAVNAAGEAITLTRADTCLFVELDWVPTAMMQAEDRGHRAGQTAAIYQVITIVARTSDCLSLDEAVSALLREKLQGINETLGEAAEIIGSRASEESVLQRVVERLLTPEELERAKSEERDDKRRHGKGSARNMDAPIEADSA